MKLTHTDRQDIVTALHAGNTTATLLAAKYGVSNASISRVYKQVTGKTLRPYHAALSQTDMETIVATLQSDKVTTQALADTYNVGASTIRRMYVQKTGKPLTRHRRNTTIKLEEALKQRTYRAWHKQERKMYEALGIDWFNQKLKILDSGLLLDDGKNKWHDIHTFILLEYSGLRDHKRTLEYPEGQEICAGDIIQFPINLDGKETMVRGTVIFDREYAWFSIPEIDDEVLVLHNDECEIIGNIYENPELIPQAA